MHALHPLAIVLLGLFTATLHGCPDHQSQGVTSQPAGNTNVTSQPAGNTKFFKCTACLADDANRCATHTPTCGELSQRSDSEISAKNALCDVLTPAEVARRPTPEGFKPTPWFKNTCYEWPDTAFKITCTTFTTTCDNVPIH